MSTNINDPLGHIDHGFNEFEKEILHIISDRFDVPIHLLEPVPVLVKSDNKPWYQDRKHFKSKKSRRKL